MLPLLLLSLGFSFYLNGFHVFVHSFNTFSPLKFKSQFSGRRISYAHFSSLTPSERDLQKYYLLRENKRPEVFVSGAASINEAITELWRAVLLSTRILDSNLDSQDYVSVTTFPDLKLSASDNGEETLRQISASVLSGVLQSPSTSASSVTVPNLFQPDIARSVKVFQMEGLLCLGLESYRTRSRDLDFEDLDVKELDPADGIPSDLSTNDIPIFPFPTVFDFISEINRPMDPATMSQLRYTFKIQDLKYDLTKLSKKKNPQELVDALNCKLTRLNNWRDVLASYYPPTPNPFLDLSDWVENVKDRFESLKYLVKTDPKKALDTQYDKKKVFLKIIDQWSDRLKRNFKYIYQSQRKQEDYKSLILNSSWRQNFISLTTIFNDAPFLQFSNQLSSFNAGEPDLNFRRDKKDYFAVWGVDVDLDLITEEMHQWIRSVQKVQEYTYSGSTISKAAPNLWQPLGKITLQTYSKGFVGERVMYDLWASLSKWVDTLQPEVLSAVEQMSFTVPSDVTLTHNTAFLESVRKLNTFSRSASTSQSKSVKDLYKTWSATSAEVTDWLTQLVSEKNVDKELDNRCVDPYGRSFQWSQVIEQSVLGDKDEEASFDEEEAKESELNRELWSRYQPIIQTAEYLKEKVAVCEPIASTIALTQSLPRRQFDTISFDSELFALSSSTTTTTTTTIHTSDPPALLFVLPRYYRDVSMGDEELDSFLELCKAVAVQLPSLDLNTADRENYFIQLTPLHPKMITQKGFPDYSRRAPYPAILLTLQKKQ